MADHADVRAPPDALLRPFWRHQTHRAHNIANLREANTNDGFWMGLALQNLSGPAQPDAAGSAQRYC